MQRGVIYIVWGGRIEPWLERSVASLKAAHPELPVEVWHGYAAVPAEMAKNAQY